MITPELFALLSTALNCMRKSVSCSCMLEISEIQGDNMSGSYSQASFR